MCIWFHRQNPDSLTQRNEIALTDTFASGFIRKAHKGPDYRLWTSLANHIDVLGGTMKNLLRYVYRGRLEGLTPLTQEEYEDRLVRIDQQKAERAFDKAWETRNFEIELYWKRATYFWAFIASAFVGYFGLVNADAYRRPDPYQHAEVYFVICLGFLLSLAWLLTNIGSKQWQRHWEVHVDLLEDQFTGPLYKTVHPSMTYSVSKINEIVSVAVVSVWVLLALKYLSEQNLLHISGRINLFVFVATMGTFVLSSAMLFGHGRGRFSERSVVMHARSIGFSQKDARGVEQSVGGPSHVPLGQEAVSQVQTDLPDTTLEATGKKSSG
jgi:hypothetical protein